jgi:hypothetical protein
VLFKAYGEEAIKRSNVFEWHKHFYEGRENLEDDERNCRPRSHRTDEDVEKVQNLVHSINQAYYVQILKRLHVAVRRKRPELGPNDWILHHDNAATH